MQTSLRRFNLLHNSATKDTLIRLFTEQCAPPKHSTFPIRRFATSRALSAQAQPTSRTVSRQSLLWRSSPFRSTRGVRYNSTNTQIPSPAPKQGGRFKDLTRKYGWAAVGVYFGLSALDFPFCFLAVRWLGTDRIAAAEEWVVEGFWSVTEKAMPGSRERTGRWWENMKQMWREQRGTAVMTPADGPLAEAAETVEDPQRHTAHHEASLATQLALAYALHKSLIVFRLPITAAITPGIVKWLRKRGWNIGRPKA